MKILILLPYYNRPIFVRRTLESILEANRYHSDWSLFFFDDNSPISGEPIVNDILQLHLEKVVIHRSNQTIEDKVENGLMLGKAANEIMRQSDADIVITLGDDDELVPTYLRDISHYFEKHPDEMYCYSKVYIFNPLFPHTKNQKNTSGIYNKWFFPIDPVNKLDSSQVAFRLDCVKKHNICYPESSKGELPYGVNFDASLFKQLFEKFGEINHTNLVAQYKGVHDYQLIWNKKRVGQDLLKFMKRIELLGGKEF